MQTLQSDCYSTEPSRRQSETGEALPGKAFEHRKH